MKNSNFGLQIIGIMFVLNSENIFGGYMLSKKLQLLFLLTFFCFSPFVINAQNEDDDFFDDDDFNFQFDFDFHGKPTISAFYGMGKTSLKGLGAKIANPNLAEIRLGYVTEKSLFKSADVINYKYRYSSLSNHSSQLGKTAPAGELPSEMWKIGLGWDEGYGYRFGKSALIFYNGSGLTWSRNEIVDGLPARLVANEITIDDAKTLAMFDGNFRFGTKSEAGVKLQIIPALILDASFERNVVFPRLMFWKAAGSYAVEGISQALLDEFIEKIIDSSPAAAPIINFLLKNGLAYGFYELRKEKMNWPFNTAAPLFNDSFKFGMTFVF